MTELSAFDLVEFLLEDQPRVCAMCQAERGITATRGESHGLCHRHAVEAYARDLHDGDKDSAAQELSAHPASYFSPDMGRMGLEPNERRAENRI